MIEGREQEVLDEDALGVAGARFAEWLNGQVLREARGDGLEELEVDPSATFWLGTLAPEATVLDSSLGERGERLAPCAVGLRVRPAHVAPWAFSVRVRACGWRRAADADESHQWVKSPHVEVPLNITVQDVESEQCFAAPEIRSALTEVGLPGLAAEVRVEVVRAAAGVEVVITMVNTTPDEVAEHARGRLFETELSVSGLPTDPFLLEALPDSFRYDRHVAAYGVNAGVAQVTGGVLATTDTVDVTVGRPAYWNSPEPEPDLRFSTLASDPIPPLRDLLRALRLWNEANWGDGALDALALERRWPAPLRAQAFEARGDVRAEEARLEAGVNLLARDNTLRQAFQLMNEAMGSAPGAHPGWRPFQLGYLLGALRFLVDVDENRYVDTVWFATGGGKTETYLGLLVMTAFHDRMTGKMAGISAWSRFPLRLLSLQQTQRFADALAGAELTRRRHGIPGMPFSLGFFVGAGGTPNKIVPVADPARSEVDPESPGMPEDYQVLLHCPFCGSPDLSMSFDRRRWSLQHRCGAQGCPSPGDHLPVYVVDQEIYRFLPTVVVGTLDKAASIGLQAAMRGFVGPPLGRCPEPGHGFTYATRSKAPTGCLVPGCAAGSRLPLPQESRRRFAPRLRLQDELHLLRDSLGAVDSHYESLLDHLQVELGGTPAKIVASSATLSGHDRQTAVLYQRIGRVFPVQGPTADSSFWTRRTSTPMRRYVAVAPRGVTLDHVTDRTISILQSSVRSFDADPGPVCAALGIDPALAPALVSLYGTDVVYGSTLYDVEAADRSLAANSALDIASVQLTGSTGFDLVREILDRLEHPEPLLADRIHVAAASSMLSHGVDVERLNVMAMLGLPLNTAEFIQATARVGRRYPGLVYVLHKIARERDARVFRQFDSYVRHGDRFVEPIPITRRSRRVLALTTSGIVEARRLALWEPRAGRALTTIARFQEWAREVDLNPSVEAETVFTMLGLDHDLDEHLEIDAREWFDHWFANLQTPSAGARFPNELCPTPVMRSLRDVEESAPIRDKGIERRR